MGTKKARSSARAVVTRKINEIIALMTDEGNVKEVNKKSGELLEPFDKFQATHEAFQKELIDAKSVYQLVFGQVDLLLENLEIWLTGIEATRAVSSIEVRPEDSVSNVGPRLRLSRSSIASKTSRSSDTSPVSARAKAAARKARNTQFEDFCNLEFNNSSHEPKMSMSENDQHALNIMEGTVKLSNDQYQIGLPWKNNPPHLENNRPQAETRLQKLKRRLQKDATLHEKYTSIFSVCLDYILRVCQSLWDSFLYLGKLHWFLYLLLSYFYDPGMFIFPLEFEFRGKSCVE